MPAASGCMPQTFGTITVSDGISMGTEGMKYSLVSREVIADSIETACSGQRMDGVLAVGGCDKNMPGAMIAMARMNIPAIFVYGGPIKPGHYHGEDLTVVSVFEAMGMSLPYSSTMAAEDREKLESAGESAKVLAEAVRAQRLPRQILTRQAFENAITVLMATGGSTNAVLHLLAIAHAAEVPLTVDDFEAIRVRVPVLCELKPSGRYVGMIGPDNPKHGDGPRRGWLPYWASSRTVARLMAPTAQAHPCRRVVGAFSFVNSTYGSGKDNHVMNWPAYGLIAIGGALGAMARAFVGTWVQSRLPNSTFPWGTFLINATGSLLLGFVATLLAERVLNIRPLVTIGFVGAYTTFSTFEYESLQLGSSLQALGNLVGSVVVGYGCVWLGTYLAHLVAAGHRITTHV